VFFLLLSIIEKKLQGENLVMRMGMQLSRQMGHRIDKFVKCLGYHIARFEHYLLLGETMFV